MHINTKRIISALLSITILFSLANMCALASDNDCSNASGHNYESTYLCSENSAKYVCSYCGNSYKEDVEPIEISIKMIGESEGKFDYSELDYISSRSYKISSTGGYGTIKYKYELYKKQTDSSPYETKDFTTTASYTIKTESYYFSGENYMLKIIAKDEAGNESAYRYKVGDLSVISKEQTSAGHNYIPNVSNKTCGDIAKVTYTCSYCQDSYVENVDDISISLECTGYSSATINGTGKHSKNYEIRSTGGYGTKKYKIELYSTASSTSPISTQAFSTVATFAITNNGTSFVAGDKVVKITVKDNYGNETWGRYKISNDSLLDSKVLEYKHTHIATTVYIATTVPATEVTREYTLYTCECGDQYTEGIDIATYDNENILIFDNADDIPEDAYLVVEENTDTEVNADVADEFGEDVSFKALDITLEQDGEKVQPSAAVTVSLAVPDGLDGEKCSVYRLESDGTFTDMQAEYVGGKLEFETEHFSIYVILQSNATPGDVNDDDKVNVRDAALILQFLAGWNVTINEDAADVNGDEKVNVRDAALILQFLAGWNVTLQ